MGKRPTIGDCALCSAQGTALARSHIIPEFKFKEAYDENHQLHQMSYFEPKKGRPMQKGWREYLLCFGCETLIRDWENYAARFFRKLNKGVIDLLELPAKDLPSNLALSPQIDYTRLRLFGFSVLWRMGASKREEFEQVALGPHLEKLGEALLNKDPLKPSKYPFFVTALTINRRFFPDWVSTAHRGRVDGHHVYGMIMGGYHFGFHVSSHQAHPIVEAVGPTIEGTITIPVVEASTFPYLNKFLAGLGEIQRGERTRLPRKPKS
jgi:hypothetical protein